MDVSSRLLAERHPELAKEETSLLVVLRVRDDGDVHTLGFIDLDRIDLGEDQVVANAEGVIAATVERFRRNAAKVANARQRDADQTIEKLIHLLAAQSDHRADGDAFAQFERRDGLLRARDDRTLPSDRGQLLDGIVEN